MYELPADFRLPQDLVDILLVAFLVYRILLLIKGTRALQVLLGLIVLVAAHTVSKWFDLVTLSWILKEFLSSFIILVVVLFQSDIRRALAHMGKQRFWGVGASLPTSDRSVDEVVDAVTALASARIGALIVIERSTMLGEHVEGGVELNASISCELLRTIFQPDTPLHDGAVVLDGRGVARAGCFLPLSARTDLDNNLGTRHRAALGITEETDAVALVVSEERGAVSLVVGGRIRSDLNRAALRGMLLDLLEVKKNGRKEGSPQPAPESSSP